MKTILIIFFCIILAGSFGGMFYYIHAVLRHRDKVLSERKAGEGDGKEEGNASERTGKKE